MAIQAVLSPLRIRSTIAHFRCVFAAPVVAAMFTVALGLPTLILPLHVDQALFVVVGDAVSHGSFPYVDAWDFKPPGLYLLYAAIARGPFDAAKNVRLFDLGWTAASAAVMVELARRWSSTRVGVIAAALYAAAWAGGNPFWQSAQPDSFVVLPLLLALLAYDAAEGGQQRSFLILAGVLLGFAFQLRFTIALYIPFLPLVVLTGMPREVRLRRWLIDMVWLGVGFTVFQVVVSAYLLAGHAIGEFIATMRYASGYTRLGGPSNTPDGPTVATYFTALRQAFWNWGWPRMVLVLPALAGGFAGAFLLKEPRIRQLVLFALLFYAGIAVQAKFFWYHYGHMVPWLALIGGWTWDRAYTALRHSYSRTVAVATVVTVATVLLLGSSEVLDNERNSWKSYLRFYRHPEGRQEFYAYFPGYLAEKVVARYVAERTRPGDSMYVWGFDPELYLLADRPYASRFLLSFPLMRDWAPSRWQDEFIAELKANRPAYIIVQRGQAGNWIVGHNIDIADYVGWFPAFQSLLETDYELETEVIGNIMYRRRP